MRIHDFRKVASGTWQTKCRRYAIVIGLFLSTTAHADDWLDTYYQYRVPFVTRSQDTGWQRLPVSELQITKSINEIEQFQFDPAFFAYNYVKLVEVDERGKVVEHPEAGFFLVPERAELAPGALDGNEEKHTISVTRDQPHLLTYTASGGGKCPAVHYETIFEPGSSMRNSDYKISSFPPLLPLAKTVQEVLFVPDRDEMQLLVGGPYSTTLHDLHVRRVRIELLAKVNSSGTKRWLLYYQPMCSHHLQVPQLRRKEMPATAVQVVEIGTANKYIGDTQYRLVETDLVGVSFADSTVKVTRQLPVPNQQRAEVTIRSAANEAQSFQLLLTPRRSGATLTGVEVSELKQKDRPISADNVDIHLVEYVPIRKSSYITPARFLGDIGDPLVPVTTRRLEPSEGNVALWFTVHTPPHTPAGTYRGVVTLSLEDERQIQVPVALEVYDFELPEFASFHTNLGGQYIATNMHSGDDARNMLDYHGLSSNDDLKALARAYYDVMADNKVCPKTVGLFAEIGMNWSPPPKGYNVDAPGNFFELQDWDFTEFNDTLSHFIDEKNVNSVCLGHTNPTVANLFKHLPGKRLDGPARSSPHTTMAWQTFREMTLVVYGTTSLDKNQDVAIEVTQKQWDDLVLKYYRRMAQNLDQHGWLDRVHILIDETENPARLNHFLELLKSDPLTARIRMSACIQGLSLVTSHHPGHAGKHFDFRNLIDTWCPQFDENYDRWMGYYWSDYDMTPDRDRLWLYLVVSSRLAIDTPGINNRLVALDIFHRGGSGLLIWETFAWDHVYGESRNPWRDPYTRHANGSLAYFYPPTRDGMSSKKPDFTITPSLRLEALREAIDDFEYAQILENLVAIGHSQDIDVAEGETVLKDLHRLFHSNTHWSQNNAWYLTLRDRMAQTIVRLKEHLATVDVALGEQPSKGESKKIDLGDGVAIELVYIPPGKFKMGSTAAERSWATGPEGGAAPGTARESYEGEQPRLMRVKDGFWMGRTKVSVGQFRRFVQESGYVSDAEKPGGMTQCFDSEWTITAKTPPYPWKSMDGKSWRDPNFGFPLRDVYPVVCVSWNDGRAFCKWLTKKEREAGRLSKGLEYRLPTEAEWAYACRGGRERTIFWWGDDLKDGEGRLNISAVDFLPGRNKIWPLANAPWSDGFAFVSPVDHYGAKGRNGFGLADMCGGVWEIVLDHFDPKGGHEEAYFVDTNPHPVCRGGNYFDVPGNARCAVRLGLQGPSYSDSRDGFRICLGVPRG